MKLKLFNRDIILKPIQEKNLFDFSEKINLVGIVENNNIQQKTIDMLIECIKYGLEARIILITKAESFKMNSLFGVSIYPQLIVNNAYIGGGVVLNEKIKTKEYPLNKGFLEIEHTDKVKLSNFAILERIHKPAHIHQYNPIWTITKNLTTPIYGTKSGSIFIGKNETILDNSWINKVLADNNNTYAIGNRGLTYKIDSRGTLTYSSYQHDSWLNCITLFKKKLIVGTANGFIIILDLSLKLIKKVKVSENEIWSITATNQKIIFGLNNGCIYNFNIETFTPKKVHNINYAVTALKQSDNLIFFSTIRGDIGCFNNNEIKVINTGYERIWDFDLINHIEIVFVSSSGYLIILNLLTMEKRIIKEEVYTAVCYDEKEHMLFCGHPSGNLHKLSLTNN